MVPRLEVWPNQLPTTAMMQGQPTNWMTPLATCATRKKAKLWVCRK
jgi:hypothetical protein